jgi:hypothetical protein
MYALPFSISMLLYIIIVFLATWTLIKELPKSNPIISLVSVYSFITISFNITIDNILHLKTVAKFKCTISDDLIS